MSVGLRAQSRCWIDGRPTPVSELGLPPTNFGQPVPGLERVAYEIQAPLDAFLDAMADPFARFSREIDDDDDDNDGFPTLQAYQALGFTTDIRQMATSAPRLLELLLPEWLVLDVLERLSTNEPRPGYAFHSLARVGIGTDTVQLFGNALRIP